MPKRIIALSVLFGLLAPVQLIAQTAEDIQGRISQRSSDIKALEAEIASYQKEINSLSSQADSLSNAIKTLDLTQKKLDADIKVTEKKIDAKNIEIAVLTDKISDTADTISYNRRIVAKSFAYMNELDNRSLVETLLSSESVSDALDSVDHIASVQTQLRERIYALEDAKVNLETNKKSTEKAKNELLVLRKQLSDQKKVVENTKVEKNQLLKETKQSESAYQTLLANRKALKEAFEREVLEFESQLRLLVDSSKLPRTGSGVLSWPLDSVYITQYFGNTEFSTANPQIYNGKGHTGIDLRASIGTPVRSSLSGTVIGVGNTDLLSTCYSFGKWVMVKHPNGLSTLYAHLSVQSVSQGQTVSTGQIVGYSGNTGYSTGPHLHFGVYASDGVQITKLVNSKNCKGMTIPIADFKAYLNPLSYL